MKSGFRIILVAGLVLVSIAVYSPGNSFVSASDITITGSEVVTISGFSTCDNLTISQEGTLILENANLQINGLIRMSDYSRLFIIDSQVELNPPPINESTIVVHATDHSLIKITEGSYVKFNPQPTATNISYMLIEDYCDFFIMDSTFRGDLPSIIHQSIEIASVTAGVFLLSGYANWYMMDSNIKGTMSFDGLELNGRWFWSSLHQRSSLYIENCDLELLGMSSSYTILKPVSGSVTLKDTRILGGKVDVEVAAQGTFTNTIFNGGVRFMDSALVNVLNCTFAKDAVIGMTLSFGENIGYNPETELEIINSTFEKNLRCDGNSSSTISGSTISSFTVKANATAEVSNSTVSGFTSVKDQSSLVMKNTDMGSVRVYETAYFSMDESQKISTIYFYGDLGKPKREGAFFENTEIQQIVVYSEFNHKMFFDNVSLGELRFYNDLSCEIELVSSDLDTIFPMRSGENVTLEFTVVDSATPDLEKQNENITIKIFHRLSVLVTLNDIGLETKVHVTDAQGNIWDGITHFGAITFDLHYMTIEDEIIDTSGLYTVSASYLGFSENRDIMLTSSKAVHFYWTDSVPPFILDIQCSPLKWNLGKEITFKILTSDLGVGSIRSAILFYKMDEGNMKDVEMFKIDENTYEAIIPKSMQATSITYHFQVTDMAGNNITSPKTHFTVGEEENYIYSVGFGALICFVSFLIMRFLVMKKKVRAYASKFEFRKGSKKH